MAKRIRRVRTFARTATKSQEKKLIENAKKLREDPFLILPECPDLGCDKYFGKIKKKLLKISKFKDDIDKLEKFANKKGIEAAFAGTISLAISEKAPYLGVIKFPTGDITYAQRGKAEKEKLIATQHFDDPIWRLLGLKDLSFKKGLNIYSWNNGFVCSGVNANPPDDFVEFIIKKLDFSRKDNVIYCKHIDIKKVKKQESLKEDYISINWKSANILIAICKDCAKSTKNTIFNISKYMLSPNLSDDFKINVISKIKHKKDAFLTPESDLLKKYLSGKLSDYEFIIKNIEKQEDMIKQSDERVFVLNGESFGSDVEKFIEALEPNKHEKKALEFILEKLDEPLIVTDVNSNKILEMFWDKYALDFINSIIDDKDMANSMFHLDDTPTNILTLVFDYKERQKILSELPQFESLPPLANFADSITKTYKTFGQKKAIAEIKKKPDTPKGRSMAYAFLLVFKKGKDTKWKYSKQEIEYGEFLKDYAEKLIESDPKNYRQRLQDLLTVSGSNEKIM